MDLVNAAYICHKIFPDICILIVLLNAYRLYQKSRSDAIPYTHRRKLKFMNARWVNSTDV